MTPGTLLLHYRLTEMIGEGGMGQVWKASDTTLGRDVAIKILPPEFAADPERFARFDREAKVLASLNHPIPAEEAKGLALEIAEALEYAHERGIVHRDLKPANIKITPSPFPSPSPSGERSLSGRSP